MIGARIVSTLRRALRVACERPVTTLWTLAWMTAALLATGLAGLAAEHVDRWTRDARGGASMVIFLHDGVDEVRAAELTAELGRLPGVESAALVPPADSAARLQEALGEDSALLEGVELAALPASVEVTLAPGVHDVISMSPTMRALRGKQGVDDIVVEDAGAGRAADALALVRLSVWIGAALIAGLGVLGALALVRLCFARGERQPAIAYLLGAGRSFTILPSALAGGALGALAGALALGLVHAVLDRHGAEVVSALRGAFGQVALSSPGVSASLAFIALGAATGILGGWRAGAGCAPR